MSHFGLFRHGERVPLLLPPLSVEITVSIY